MKRTPRLKTHLGQERRCHQIFDKFLVPSELGIRTLESELAARDNAPEDRDGYSGPVKLLEAVHANVGRLMMVRDHNPWLSKRGDKGLE